MPSLALAACVGAHRVNAALVAERSRRAYSSLCRDRFQFASLPIPLADVVGRLPGYQRSDLPLQNGHVLAQLLDHADAMPALTILGTRFRDAAIARDHVRDN